MNQDWEWEDLLTEQEKKKRRERPNKRPDTARETVVRSKAPSGTGKRNAGEESRRRSNLVGNDGRPKPKPKPKPKPQAEPKSHPEPQAETKPRQKPQTERVKERTVSGDAAPAPKKKKQKQGRKQARKKSVFPWIYLVFVVLLAIAGALIVRNVRLTMVELRDNTPDTFIRYAIGNLTDQDLTTLFPSNPSFETPGEAAANIRSYLSDPALELRRIEHNEYEAHRDGRKLFAVHLNASHSVNKLGLINYDILTSAGIEPVPDTELFRCEITAPSSYEITVNGKPAGEPKLKKALDGFADAADFVEMPSINTYVFDHLTKEPLISVTDSGREVPVTPAEKIDLTQASDGGHTFSSTEEAGIDFDAMGFAKDWALFMRDDLGGEAHGYYKLEPFLIADSALQTKAYQWASNVDITFTSNHTLLDPPFTDEAISDVAVYGENAASVDVSLKMHMVLDRGQERTDVIDTTLYLIRQDGTWKVVNIRDDSASSDGD